MGEQMLHGDDVRDVRGEPVDVGAERGVQRDRPVSNELSHGYAGEELAQ